MDYETTWNVLDSYFRDNPKCFVQHHIQSFDDFYDKDIYKIFKEKNPVSIFSGKKQDNVFDNEARLYFGGKNGDRIYFGKPCIYDERSGGDEGGAHVHYMYPNEARLRNMTYGMTIHYDIEIEIITRRQEGAVERPPTKLGEGGEDDEDIIQYVKRGGDGRTNSENGEHTTNKVGGGGEGGEGGEGCGVEVGGGPVSEHKKQLQKEIDNIKKTIRAQTEKDQIEQQQKSPYILNNGGGRANSENGVAGVGAGISEEVDDAVGDAVITRTVGGAGGGGIEIKTKTIMLEKIFLGNFPIMLHSKRCILNSLSRSMLSSLGEDTADYGGYFIIDGKEKTVVCQEKFADNMLYIRDYHKADGGADAIDAEERDILPYLYSAEIRSVSENVSKPQRTLSIRMVAPDPYPAKRPKDTEIIYMERTLLVNRRELVVYIPNVRHPVPLFILFRALGVLSDEEIMRLCCYNLGDTKMLSLLIPSVYDNSHVFTQETALDLMAIYIKGGTRAGVYQVLADYFLPHVGEVNFTEKAYYLGYMVNRLLRVVLKRDLPINRDNYNYKRVETIGPLLRDLFREYYTELQRFSHLKLEYKLNFNENIYANNLEFLIQQNHAMAFQTRYVDDGFKKAFKGNWGATPHTKRVGIVQDLNRISNNSAISHLRKTNLTVSMTTVVEPHLLHCSHWGMIDPIDTPDGANVGLHKNLAILTYITRDQSREPLIAYLRKHIPYIPTAECQIEQLAKMTKLICNGYWFGCIYEPVACMEFLKKQRRYGLIPAFVSVAFNTAQNTIFLYTDGGRLCRPLYFWDNETQQFSYMNQIKKLENRGGEGEGSGGDGRTNSENGEHTTTIRGGGGGFKWANLVAGFMPENQHRNIYDTANEAQQSNYYDNWTDLYKTTTPYNKKNKAVLEYIDTNETEHSLIANTKYAKVNVPPAVGARGEGEEEGGDKGDSDTNNKRTQKYTHQEIHESTIFGIMCNLINYIENNPAVRNSFSCSQSKQAVSLYHAHYNLRMDKMSVVLNNGQVPIIKTRYLEYINREKNPYGENAIVAIMCYTGYNVEDAILINEGSIKRGLFQTTYYTTYTAHEEYEQRTDTVAKTLFTNLDDMVRANVRQKTGYDYKQLDERGIIREGTIVHSKMIMIGLVQHISGGSKVGGAKGDGDEGGVVGDAGGEGVVGEGEAGGGRAKAGIINQYTDASVVPKKGQLGIVDKVYITEEKEGKRLVKVRVRHIRIPNLGDKMASRAGQKGTIGMIIQEKDMPFTRGGERPDLIINPHALPTRMTIGQLVECLNANACVHMGGFGDCTAYNSENTTLQTMKQYANLLPQIYKNTKNTDIAKKQQTIGQEMSHYGFHSSGNNILYNGFSGKQIECEIFIGPTYYMRLKHMVKDKINYRATGPRTALTRQPVGGRANDGGLRIGEMERDSLLGHGISQFLRESMMERGDKYYFAICNKTGMLAIYNPFKKLFYSPTADGPVQYTGTLEENTMEIKQHTQFGRDFSIICAPYSLKLLIQELQCMNVNLRIITEDNIEHMDALLTGNHNIEKMAHLPVYTPPATDTATTAPTDIKEIKKSYFDNIKKNNVAFIDEIKKAQQQQSKQGHKQALEPTPTEQTKPSTPEAEQALEQGPVKPNTPEETPPPITEKRQEELRELYKGQQQPKRFIPSSPEGPPPPLQQERFIPRSPDEPPPPSLGGGGGNGEAKPYEIGQYVYGGEQSEWRQYDPKPDRLWRIDDIGKHFITVSTNDKEGLNEEDTTRVVEPHEMVALDEWMPPLPPQQQQQQIEQHPQPPASGFTFSPSIKIIQGNDQSTNTATATDAPPMTTPQQQPTAYQPLQQQEQQQQYINQPPETPQPRRQRGQGQDNNGETEVDLTKTFLIKKI